VLHRDDAECGEETEAEREETLHFRFVTRVYNTATEFSDARGARYSLAVDFIALRASQSRSVDFALTPLDREDRTFAATPLGLNQGDAENERRAKKLDVLLVGVLHDRGLPSIRIRDGIIPGFRWFTLPRLRRWMWPLLMLT